MLKTSLHSDQYFKSTNERNTPKILPVKGKHVHFNHKNYTKQISKRREGSVWKLLTKQWGYALTDDLLKGMSKYMKAANKVQRFNMECHWSNYSTDVGLAYIGGNLKRMTSLKSFSWHVYQTMKITDQGVRSLCEGLSRITSLHTIKLSFRLCVKITDESLRIMGENFQKLPSLQSIVLNFSQNTYNISDKGVQSLIEPLKKLTCFRKIYLDFSECRDVGNESLKTIAEFLKKQPFLQTLGLNFSWNKKITNSEGLISLSEAMNKLTALQHVSLLFEAVDGIEVDGLKKLGQALRSLTSLHVLILNFCKKYQMTDECLESVSDALESMPCFRAIIDFSDCPKITNRGRNKFKENINKHKTLKKISLYLGRIDGDGDYLEYKSDESDDENNNSDNEEEVEEDEEDEGDDGYNDEDENQCE